MKNCTLNFLLILFLLHLIRQLIALFSKLISHNDNENNNISLTAVTVLNNLLLIMYLL